tara:strand:- start:300 stop:695 length:396 start_codon:yes stop_codon:yes gene_type:complete
MNSASLILDGDCGLCNRLAIFLNPRLNENSKLLFLTNESDEGIAMISQLSQKKQDADTVYLIKNEKTYIRSAAAIRCLLFMKWHYKILYPFCWIVPLPIRDLVYIIISKNRHKFFAKPEVCMIPSSNNRDY